MPKPYPCRCSIRLKEYDYSQSGLYFVTICTHNRQLLFGTIRENEMILNRYGKIAHDCWLSTEQIRPNIILGNFIVMPNHIHVVFAIDDRRGVLHTPVIDNILHVSETNMPSAGVCNTPLQSPSQTVGAIVRGYKSAVTKHICQLGFTEPVWQRNYYEHIIRNEIAFDRISQYIIENPARWQNDCLYSREKE